MINYDTILSSFDDKLTLMQWLKKVEAALKDASAVSFKVNKKGDATLTFSIVFDDGSEIESDPLTLEQGESVASAYIQNGNLHLVLTNGDDLDAGNMFDGNITLTGSITAASVKTSSLTSDADEIAAQKPVIEVMTGYSYQGGTSDHVNLAYLGISKNGNKLSMVFAGQILGGEDGIAANTRLQIGIVGVPYSIGTKLVPIQEGTSYVDMKHLYIGTEYFLEAEARFYLIKSSNSIFYSAFNLRNALEASAVRAFRYEITFLLSDNLAA